MPRVIIIAEGLHDPSDGTPRHQTVLSERIDADRLPLGGFRANLQERISRALLDATDIEEHPHPNSRQPANA